MVLFNYSTNNIFSLSNQDTAQLKGIAIVAMLAHHVLQYPPTGFEYGSLLTTIGVLGKVCVAIFLFCSGYGLFVQFSKLMDESETSSPHTQLRRITKNTIAFLLNRFAKFYAGYWPVFLIFVPITIFCFDRSLADAYGENVNVIKRLVYDFIGIQGWNSYNSTWWFNKLILIFYLLFPAVYVIIRKCSWVGVVMSCILCMLSNALLKYDPFELLLWQFPFVMGMFYKQIEGKMVGLSKTMTQHKYFSVFLIILLLAFFVCQRLYGIISRLPDGMCWDTLLVCCLVLLMILLVRETKYLSATLSFLGKHSMNIYLLHTFVHCYWGKVSSWVYSPCVGARYGINVLALLGVCLLLSLLVEAIKKHLGWNVLINLMIGKIKGWCSVK